MTQRDAAGKDRRERFYVAIGVVLLIFGLGLFILADGQSDENKAKLDGQLCLLHELQSHRVNSYDADRDQAAAEKRPFNVPLDPPIVDSRLADACERFIEAR